MSQVMTVSVFAQQQLRLAALVPDQIGIEVDVVHAGKGVDDVAEFLPELGGGQHVAVGVDARRVEPVPIDQMVAHLVRGVGQQHHDFAAAAGHAAQQQGEAVAAEDGEGHAHGAAAGFGAHVGSDLIDAGVVALGPGDDRLRHRDDVPVAGGDVCFLPGLHHGLGRDGSDIVALADDRRANPAYNGSDGSHRCMSPLPDDRRVFKSRRILYTSCTEMARFFIRSSARCGSPARSCAPRSSRAAYRRGRRRGR